MKEDNRYWSLNPSDQIAGHLLTLFVLISHEEAPCQRHLHRGENIVLIQIRVLLYKVVQYGYRSL